KKLGKKGETLSMFLGRAHSEPEPVYSMVDAHYALCRNEFIGAFKRHIPNCSESQYQWYFEFMLSLIVCFLTRNKPVIARYSMKSDWDVDDVTACLVAFCATGMAKEHS
ncbi:MAG: hypothetical protein JST89_26600, partial [Cyanobacteria bacterium SZAS-4]|nr:hypothetical protein [Cyanobacteria bacterium SZAS-4]